MLANSYLPPPYQHPHSSAVPPPSFLPASFPDGSVAHYRHGSGHQSPASSIIQSPPGSQSFHSPSLTTSPLMQSHGPYSAAVDNSVLHQHHPYSLRSHTAPSVMSMVPSPPSSCPSSTTASSNTRYEVILEAPTAAVQKQDDSPLTYLNKGQYYNVTLKDTEGYDGDIQSTAIIMFHDESHRKVAPNYWKFWLSQQKDPSTARAVDIDMSRSNGVHGIECRYFDRITFHWNGRVGANISIRFNCLSTDFSRIKGVKGIPLRLHMESMIPTQPQSSEKSYCRIKLFRDKGAERKNKDDAKHIEKQLEKLRGRNGESHPFWVAYSQTQPYTRFCEVPSSSSLSPQQIPMPTGLMRRLSDSSTGTSGSHQRLDSSSVTGHPTGVLLPPPLLGGYYHQGTKRPYSHNHYPPSLLSPPLPTDGTVSGGAAAAAANVVTSMPSPYYLSLDVDPAYVPQRRARKAKLCLFAKYAKFNDNLHRAIYLEHLTVADLIEKVIAKMETKDTPEISKVVRRVANKDDLTVQVDDAVVQDMHEEQVVEIQTETNDDGTWTLVLRY